MSGESFVTRVASAIGCDVIWGAQPGTPDWCDEHEAEWPCPELNRALPVIAALVSEALVSEFQMCACGHTRKSHARDGCFACAGPPCDMHFPLAVRVHPGGPEGWPHA